MTTYVLSAKRLSRFTAMPTENIAPTNVTLRTGLVVAVSVPGRNGDLIVSNNRYENIQISYNVFLSAKSVDELAEKLSNSVIF